MKRTCGTKRRFPDHKSAINALRRLRERSTRARQPIRVYECPHCNGWHMTNQEQRR